MSPRRASPLAADAAEASAGTDRLDREESGLAATFYRELQHRTANIFNLAILQLEVQARQSAADLRPAFSAAAANLRHLVALQIQFDMPDWRTRADAATEVSEAHAALARAWAAVRPGVRFDCRIDADARFRVRPAGLLSLIASELVTNAYKHAFQGREHGTLTVTLQRAPQGRGRLSVIDDGPGFQAAPARHGQGMALVEALAGAIGGELSIAGGGVMPTRVCVTFDPERS